MVTLGSGASTGVRAAIALAIVAAVIFLHPFQEAPFLDDWAYAWSVQDLLVGAELRVLDWSAHVNVVQVLWGAFFCLSTGFSFAALRFSTFVLALATLLGMYRLLRALGADQRASLTGTAVLGLHPVFFMLSFTFMTDVPFLAAMVWSMHAMVQAIRQRSDRWLAVFAVLGSLSAGVRVVAIATGVAALVSLWWHGGRWGRAPGRLLLAVAPLVALGAFTWWVDGRVVHVTDLSFIQGSPVFRRQYLTLSPAFLAPAAIESGVFVAGFLGIALMPLALALIPVCPARRAVVIFAVLVCATAAAGAAGLPFALPMVERSLWSWREVGGAETMVGGYQPLVVPAALCWGLALLAFASFAVTSAVVSSGIWPLDARAAEARGASPELARPFLLWLLAGHFALVVVLWLTNDRYCLPMLPVAIALVIAARPLPASRAATASLILLSLISFAGARDHLAYNRALWQAVDDLRGNGVKPGDIDGGYAVNGWLHYANLAQAPRDAGGAPYFPWLTHAGGVLPYQLSNRPLAGWEIVGSVPYSRWPGRSGAIYALRRLPLEK